MNDQAADRYVTSSSWAHGRCSLGRPDLIDDVADQFERRSPTSGDDAARVSYLDEMPAARRARAARSRSSIDRRIAG